MIEGVVGLGPVAAKAAANSASAAAPTSGASFDEMLGKVASGAVDSLKSGEAAAIQGIQGAAPTFKVAEALMGAQRSLQAALAIRDKAVSAYQEISRMAI